jgi:hypothetical protein
MPIPSSGQESVRTKQPAELPIFYSPAYTMSAYNFDTTRKATWVAHVVAATSHLWRRLDRGWFAGIMDSER